MYETEKQIFKNFEKISMEIKNQKEIFNGKNKTEIQTNNYYFEKGLILKNKFANYLQNFYQVTQTLDL